MRVLVVEKEAGLAETVVAELTLAGHEVVRCDDPQNAGHLCNGLPGGTGCPLEQHPIDVTVAVRDEFGGPTSDREAGVRCSLRKVVPVMVVGNLAGASYRGWVDEVAASSDSGLAERVSALGAEGFDGLRAVAQEEVRKVLVTHGHPVGRITADVHRDDDRLVIKVLVEGAVDPTVARMAATRVMAAVPAARPGFSRVDIGVVGDTCVTE